MIQQMIQEMMQLPDTEFYLGQTKNIANGFGVFLTFRERGSEVQFGRSIQTRIRPKQNKSKNKRQINRQTKDKLSVKSKTKQPPN